MALLSERSQHAAMRHPACPDIQLCLVQADATTGTSGAPPAAGTTGAPASAPAAKGAASIGGTPPVPGLGNEGEDVELGSGKRRAKRYFPFAEGPRHCVGMSLANITLPATLAVLLSRFSFKLADEVRRPCTRFPGCHL